MFGPCRIHGGPLDVVAQVTGMRYGVVDPFRHFIHRQIWDRTMKGGRPDERVNARLRSMAHRVPTAVNISEIGTRQTTDYRFFGSFRNF